MNTTECRAAAHVCKKKHSIVSTCGRWAVCWLCAVEVSRALLSCDSCVVFALCISIRSPGLQGSVVPRGATTQKGHVLYSSYTFHVCRRKRRPPTIHSLPRRHLMILFPEKHPPERGKGRILTAASESLLFSDSALLWRLAAAPDETAVSVSFAAWRPPGDSASFSTSWCCSVTAPSASRHSCCAL